MSRHHTVCVLESHYNTIHNVANIYWWKFFVSIFMNEFYYQVNSIGNVVCKTYTSSYCLAFFLFLLFPPRLPQYISWEYSCWYQPTDLAMKSLVGKCHRNIPTKEIYQCFCLYLKTWVWQTCETQRTWTWQSAKPKVTCVWQIC